MQNRKLKRVLLLLVVMAILPPPLRLIDNQLNAQNDAFFYSISPERSEGSTGFTIRDFSNVVEGGDAGCSINGFDGVSADAPLGSGVLLLAGSAVAWMLVKDRKKLRN